MSPPSVDPMKEVPSLSFTHDKYIRREVMSSLSSIVEDIEKAVAIQGYKEMVKQY